MTFVELREGEMFEALLRRFKNAVAKDGLLREFRHRQHFVPQAQQRRLKAAEARRRQTRRSVRGRLAERTA